MFDQNFPACSLLISKDPEKPSSPRGSVGLFSRLQDKIRTIQLMIPWGLMVRLQLTKVSTMSIVLLFRLCLSEASVVELLRWMMGA
jgi:hypothetical protein